MSTPAGRRLLAEEMPAAVYWALAAAIVAASVAYASALLLHAPQLEPDDFRFVAGALGLRPDDELAYGVVDNRWDELPFVDVDGGLRFWRPLLPASFWFDAAVTGGFEHASVTPQARFGAILRTNIALHAACCLLTFAVCARTCGRTAAALLGGAFFACFAPHAEAIWYGAGRNATLLTLTFTGAVLLHPTPSAGAPAGRARRALAPIAVGAALLAKETAVVLLPLLWIQDRLTTAGARRHDRAVWTAYGAVALLWFVSRVFALGGVTSGQLVEPYVHLPWVASFWPHVGAAVVGGLEAISLGSPLWPFLSIDELALAGRQPLLGAALGAAALALVAAVAWPLARGRLLLAFAFLAWLPTLPVYVSERYLYLPSVPLAALLGLAVFRAASRRALGGVLSWGLAAVVVVAAGHHLRVLHGKHGYASSLRTSWGISAALQRVARDVPRGATLIAVDLPGDVLHAQFFEDQLRVTCDDPDLRVRVLSLLPEAAAERRGGARLAVSRSGDEVVLRGVERPVLARSSERIFPIVRLTPGDVHATADGSVRMTVVVGDGVAATELRFGLAGGFEHATLLRYVPPAAAAGRRTPGQRVAAGRFSVGW